MLNPNIPCGYAVLKGASASKELALVCLKSAYITPSAVTWSLPSTVSDDAWGFSNMDGETYTDLSVDVPIGSTPITLSAHVGYQTFGDQGDGADYDYTDWKLNADYAFNDNFSAGAFYTDTDQKKDNWTVAGEFLGDSAFGGYISAGF